MTGLESAVQQLTIFVFICQTDKSKPVKQEVNGTEILPRLVFPAVAINFQLSSQSQRIYYDILNFGPLKNICVEVKTFFDTYLFAAMFFISLC